MFNAAPPCPVNLLFYPDYRDANPYQSLLYGALGPAITAQPVPDFARFFADTGGSRRGGILHLHWENAAIQQDGMSPEGFLDALSAFRGGGGRIVWTMHNLLPHDPRTRATAEQIRTGLMTLADIIHLHSLPALAAAMDHHALPLEKVRIIAHGNYDGAYPVIRREDARAALNLTDAGTVLLLPGQIRAYKGAGDLVSAFLQVAGPQDRLILAGHRMADVADLVLPDDPRIMAQFGFASATDLARAFAAADIVVLPYVDSLTSGSAILAQTLGRGVLGTDTPGLRDAVAMPGAGTLFDARGPDALASALRHALEEGPEVWRKRGETAAQAARARNWAVLGAAWRSVFRDLANLPRSARVAAQ